MEDGSSHERRPERRIDPLRRFWTRDAMRELALDAARARSAEPTTSDPPGIALLRAALDFAALANAQRVEAALTRVGPDVVVPGLPQLGYDFGFEGRDGLRHYFARTRARGFIARADITSAAVTSFETVLAEGRLHCTDAGQSLTYDAWYVYRFREGLLIRLSTHLDRRAAVVEARS